VIKYALNSYLEGDSFMISNIVLYLIKNKCLKLKLKNYPLNLSLTFLLR